MVVTVSPTDPRSVRALAVLATADRWTKGHRKSNGKAVFVIPGSQGRIYWTDCRSCTCPDFGRNSQIERDFACKHVIACRMWAIQQGGKKAKAQPKARKKARPSECPDVAAVVVQTYGPTRYDVLFPAED